MRRGTLRTPARTLAALGCILFGVAVSACGSSSDDPNSINNPDNNGTNPNNPPGAATTAPTQTPADQVKQILDSRKTDYSEALRTASLKLRDTLPTLAEIKTIDAATDDAGKKAAYEKLVDAMIADPKFSATMIKFFKDTFRTGQVGAVQMGVPSKDTAATFAAEVVIEGRPYTDILTATSMTCPTYDMTTNTFTPAACMVGIAGPVSGVLTDPGILSQYISNMAFRRSRFIQETFACSKFPSEYGTTPKPVGNGTFTGAFPFESITGKQNPATPNPKIDFQDTTAVICANCHENQNRMAPAFINYDKNGLLTATSQVQVPIPGNPMAARIDYLPPTESLAWRVGKPYTDIPGLGAAMASDPDIAKCAVNRAWNYALSRGDIVNDLATIPDAVTADYVTAFTAGKMNFKETLRSIFKSEDFTKF